VPLAISLHLLIACVQQYLSNLFHQASPSVATFLATDQPNVVGSYLRTCFA